MRFLLHLAGTTLSIWTGPKPDQSTNIQELQLPQERDLPTSREKCQTEGLVYQAPITREENKKKET